MALILLLTPTGSYLSPRWRMLGRFVAVAGTTAFLLSLTKTDPAVVSHLMGNSGLADQLDRPSAREREVLELMAQGRSNAAIAADLVIDLRTVESHIARIMTKLELHQTADEHRRVLAVLAWLRT